MKKYNPFGVSEKGRRTTWSWAVPLLVFGFLLGGQILILLPAKYLGLFTRENVETYPQILYLIIGAFGMAALIFVLWIKFFEGRSLASAGLVVGPGAAKRYARGFGVGLLMAAAVVYGVRLLGGYDIEATTSFMSASLLPILILMFAFMLQSGTEEFIFRGWMLARLTERYGLWVGIAGNSLLFTLMHVDSESLIALGVSGIAIFTAVTLLFSVFTSLWVAHEGSIWGAAAWHASWNWMFITWFGLPTTGIELGLAPLVADFMPSAGAPVWLTGGTDGPEGSFLAPLVLAIGCGAVAILLRKKRN